MDIQKVIELRRELHENPEPSEQEVETRRRLMDFLKEHTDVEIVDKKRWFYAVKREEGATETIAFRADHDAIISEDGKAFHGCGHDGHSAILAGLAWNLDDKKTGKNIVYLFQHAEENGAGAKECVDIFDEVDIDRIYGLHNFPHFEKGIPSTKAGTMMCASKGMTVYLEGKQSHASEPENGINPVYTIADLTELVKPLVEFHGYQPVEWNGYTFPDMVLCTIVNVKVGEQGAFGVSPSRGEISFTLRAANLDDLTKLSDMIEEYVREKAEERGLKYRFTYSDEFPDTSNDPKEVERLRRIFKEHGVELQELKEPFRGSEDFGWYTKKVPGSYLVLGSGLDYADLHTVDFNFPDEIIQRGIDLFTWIAME